jgi:malonyl-CoA O-methyltransferase
VSRAPGPQEFRLDPRLVRRSFDRAANGYDESAVLQARVRLELLERLELLRIEPAVIVDLGAGTGGASRELKRRYRGGRVVAVDIAEAMLRRASRRQGLLRRFARVCGDAAALPFRDGSVDMVFSNLALHWSDNPDQVFAECSRVLAPGGVLTFTTYGPDTLVELRRAWATADGHVHVNHFIDMHDLGDALVRAGFTEPVMDVERYTLTYERVTGLMRDLKAIGARNVNAGRSRSLTGKGALARMTEAYEQCRIQGRLPATFEVVYGQAWRPVGTQRRRAPGEAVVPVSSVGRRKADGEQERG